MDGTYGFGAPRRCHHRRYDPFYQVEKVMDEVLPIVAALQVPAETRPAAGNGYSSQVDFNEKGDMALRCEIHGYKPDEVHVDLDGDVLHIRGAHKEEKDGELVERTFNRQLKLPKHVDTKKIACQLDEATSQLTVQIPKIAAPEKKKVSVPIELKKDAPKPEESSQHQPQQ